MLSRNQIKYISDLSQKPVRYSEKKFVLEGEKMVAELMGSDFAVDSVYAVTDWEAPKGMDYTLVTEKELSRISHLKSPNKVLAVVHFPEKKKADKVETGVTLFLDRINDPGNLGTIIRIADWFGVKHIYCTENSVDVFNNKVIQSSMGSVFRIGVEYVNGHEFLADFSQKHSQTPILAAEMTGQKLGEFSFPESALLIMGSESHGVDSAYHTYIQQRVHIPGFGDAESLNVAVATSIILWEWRRGSLSLKM